MSEASSNQATPQGEDEVQPNSKSTATPTPAETRAQRNGWSDAYLHARRSAAAALKDCRKHYRKHTPDTWNVYMLSARVQIEQSFRDWETLDELLKEIGEEPTFIDNFSVLKTNKALHGIHCRAHRSVQASLKANTPAFKAIRKGDVELAQTKLTLENFRELLRDGWTPEQACELMGSEIQRSTKIRPISFVTAFADLLKGHKKQPLGRDLTGWIERAWLTLCLWECPPDGRDAFDRCAFAGTLLGLWVDRDAESEAKFFLQFQTAWRNVRNKKFRL